MGKAGPDAASALRAGNGFPRDAGSKSGSNGNKRHVNSRSRAGRKPGCELTGTQCPRVKVEDLSMSVFQHFV